MSDKWSDPAWLEAKAREIGNHAIEVWVSGGWAMVGLAVLSLIIFAMGLHVYFGLRSKRFELIRERTWRHWIDNPGQRRGPVGQLLNAAGDAASVQDTAERFEEIRQTEVSPFERDLKIMKICVSAAPLLGLLGTVMGMLDTFSALATGSGGDKTMNLVAGGISEALITTETGLVIAIPGLFFQYQLNRKNERYKAFLAHLETACAQAASRRERRRAGTRAEDVAYEGQGQRVEEKSYVAVS